MTNIQTDFKDLQCVYDINRQAGRSYYKGACSHIDAHVDGKYLNLVDGGAVDWTQKFTNNGKEKTTISGVGVDRLCMLRTGSSSL